MPTTKDKTTTQPASTRTRATDTERDETYRDFTRLVNMNSGEIEKWLKTEESKSVGQDSGDGKSIGAKSGAKIAKLLEKDRTKLTKADYNHMKRVISYISRHSAQGPTKADVENSNWRYSLMNWGHDPLKK
ncbi:MAG: DUF3140 domain-containing protein [Cytophagales bacterium]|nr:DUF3140 domain-containing protein [Cytophagales bacterium]